MSTSLLSIESSPAETFDVALLDLDGVVYRGADAVPYAAESIAAARSHGLRAMYVTNNANRPPTAVAEHLQRLGVCATAEDVMTSAQAAAALVAADYPAGTAVYVIGGAGLRDAVEAEGLRIVDSADAEPAVVIQGFAPAVGWAELTEGLLAIARGAEHVASNLDATLPTERGNAVGNGSLVAALVNATGTTPRSGGKPQPGIFHQAVRRAGARRPLAVGDRLDTDLEGARAAHIPGMHVLTGVDGVASLLRSPAHRRPDLLGLDLRDLLQPHPGVGQDDGWWVCRRAAARVRDGQVELARTQTPIGGETPIDLDELRAACAAAWNSHEALRTAHDCDVVAVGKALPR